MKFLALPMDLPRRRVFYEPEHSFADEEFLIAEIKSDYVKPLENALEDGPPCVLGTVSADNKPEISPKGSVIEDAAVTTDVYDRMCEREQKADSGRKGHAVMIAIDRITNLRGDDV